MKDKILITHFKETEKVLEKTLESTRASIKILEAQE